MIELIPLSGGRVAIVDEEDYESVKDFRWHFNPKTGYVYRYGLNEKTGKHGSIYLHRQIMGFPDNLVDHKDGVKVNCRRSNLREATPSQNQYNKRKQAKKSASKFKGVTKSEYSWVARIHHNKKRLWLGAYKTEEEAAIAYNSKAKELFGEFAVLNNVG